MIKNIINRYYAFYLAIMVFFVDRIIKILVSRNLLYNDDIQVLDGILSMTKAFNTGAAFGMFKDNALYLAIFSIFVMLIITFILLKRYNSINIPCAVAWGLILGGTAGNLFDRLTNGYVIDFIKLDFINFPIFNIADLCINAGSIVLIVYLLFFSNENKPNKKISSELIQ